MKRSSMLVLAVSSALVSACASGPTRAPVASTPNTAIGRVPAPQILREAGLESVIGKRASALTQRFGQARIDLSEGDARKLQFSSDNCVLDIFLYPLERASNPVATHVEARQRVGGGDTDRARCIEDVARSARGG